MKTMTFAVAALALMCVTATAQDKPAVPAGSTKTVTPDDPKAIAPVAAAVPQVSEDAQHAISELQIKGAGIATVQALLQKEMDSVNADFARVVRALQQAQPDYDVVPGRSGLVYAPKKKDAPKTDPPK